MARLLHVITLGLVLCLIQWQASATFISRQAWNARPPHRGMTGFRLPPTKVIVHHTVTPTCSSRHACNSRVRGIQIDHQRKWNDIGYNFLIAPSGDVYEGRGWCYQGAHAGSRANNRISIGVSFIGNFQRADVTNSAWRAYQDLIRAGQRDGKLAWNARVLGHRDLKATACPGNILYRRLRS